MSAQSDEQIRVAVADAQQRLRTLLDRFAPPGASWEDYPSMNADFLQHLKYDLVNLSLAIESRIQELAPWEPIEFGTTYSPIETNIQAPPS